MKHTMLRDWINNASRPGVLVKQFHDTGAVAIFMTRGQFRYGCRIPAVTLNHSAAGWRNVIARELRKLRRYMREANINSITRDDQRVLDALYRRGWDDAINGRNYDPRGSSEWEAVADRLNASG